MTKTERTLITVIILVVLVGGVGWALNLVKFVMADFKEPYKEEIFRGVGIIAAPLGSILGYMTFKEPTLDAVFLPGQELYHVVPDDYGDKIRDAVMKEGQND
jgi:hypothetical protein